MLRPAVALLAWVLLLAANHLFWAALDGQPPAWDRAVNVGGDKHVSWLPPPLRVTAAPASATVPRG